jgi:hypothetical protein
VAPFKKQKESVNNLIIIHAHGNPQSTFDLNVGSWENRGIGVVLVSPENSPVRTSHVQMCLGRAENRGRDYLARCRKMIALAATADLSVLAEDDTLCLLEQIKWEPGLHCPVMPNLEGARFLTRTYPGYPFMLDRDTAKALLKADVDNPTLSEETYGDRWNSAMAMKAGIELQPFSEGWFVRNTITTDDYPALEEALRSGCGWIHGVKDKHIHDFIYAHK